MPLLNALLVRWAGGWHEVVDDASVTTHGRREALLGLGAVQSLGELERVAREQLRIYGEPRIEISADVEPVDDTDTPYLGYLVGDTIEVPGMSGALGRERVLALTVAEDQDGNITFAPELRNVLLSRNERIEQAIKKMSDGTLRGDSKVATPVSQISGNTTKDCCPPMPPKAGGGGSIG